MESEVDASQLNGLFGPPAPHSASLTANWDGSNVKDLEIGEIGKHRLGTGMNHWGSQSSGRMRFWSMGSLPKWTEPGASDEEEEDAAFVDWHLRSDVPDPQCIETEPVHFWQVERRPSILPDGTQGPDVQQWVLHHDVNTELTDLDVMATSPPPKACNEYEDDADCSMFATPAHVLPITPDLMAIGPTLISPRVHVEAEKIPSPSPIQAQAVAAASERSLSTTLLSEEEQAEQTAAPLKDMGITDGNRHTDSGISDLLAGAAPFRCSTIETCEADLDDVGAFALTTAAIFRATSIHPAGEPPRRRSSTFRQMTSFWTEDQPIEAKQL